MTVASFLSPFSITATAVALPALGREFGLTSVEVAWVATAYLVGAAVVLIPLGRLSDIYGRRRVFLASLAVFTTGSALCAGALSGGGLVAFRLLQGVGGGTLFSGILALLASVFSSERRGVPFGLSVGAVYLGATSGPVLGGLLTEAFGWRSVFAVMACAGVGVGALTLVTVRGEWAEARGEPFDVVGAVLTGLFLTAALYGLSRLPEAAGIAVVVAAVPVLAALVWWERRVHNPVVEPGLLLRNRVFAFANLAALLYYAGTFGVGFLLSLYLQDVRGLGAAAAGAVLAAQPLVQCVVAPAAGWLSHRTDPRRLAAAGVSVTAPSLVALAFLDHATPLGVITAILALLGVGYALFAAPNASVIMGAVDRRSYGVASTTFSAMRLVGQSVSMTLIVAMLALTPGQRGRGSGSPLALVDAMRWAFALSTLLIAGALAAEHHSRNR